MRFIDLLKINPNNPKVVQWEKTAKSHWNTLKTLKTHDERREYFKQNPFWNEFKDILMDKFGKKKMIPPEIKTPTFNIASPNICIKQAFKLILVFSLFPPLYLCFS